MRHVKPLCHFQQCVSIHQRQQQDLLIGNTEGFELQAHEAALFGGVKLLDEVGNVGAIRIQLAFGATDSYPQVIVDEVASCAVHESSQLIRLPQLAVAQG